MSEQTIRKTAQELKQRFLEEAGPLVEEYIMAALGKGELSSTNAGAREKVWELLSQLMLQSSDKLELEITCPEDVIKAVTEGKCTMQEGQNLLKLYKAAKEIETIGNSPGVGGSAGITINILSGEETKTQVIEHAAPHQLSNERR